MEIWKDIDSFPGYQVSNKGRVRSFGKVTSSARFEERHWKDRIIKPKIGKDKCARVELWRGSEHKTVLVHRAEAVAFLGGSLDSDLTVNHKDGNRLNNNIDNLEWMTRGDNIRHGFENGLYTCSHPVILVGEELLVCKSYAEADRKLGRCKGYVSMCLKSGRLPKNKDGREYTVLTEDNTYYGKI